MTVQTRPFDPADYLDGPEAIAAYLEGAFADGDPAEIADALGVVARARGMTTVAEQTGLSRQALYKALSDEGNPSLSTLLKVTRALGVRLSFQPA
ncbi:addiction module antidote protein [Brevundimonas aveniformis]|uniref:addiction module antidote protein n=1 Tax=Brevundimonas aveniformis TaxID=370977 RepID=UPI000409602B|nr:addiction module antidote protein [Brevundimonas aveniformis]